MKKSAISKRQMLLWVLSLLIVLSMVCSFLFTLTPQRERPSPTPTLVFGG